MPTTFKIWLASALLACALPGSLAFAQPTEGLAFEELEARLSDHPSLTALTYQAEASRERGTAATALPDPVVSVGVNNFPIFDPSFSDFLPTNKAVGVRQDFPNRTGRQARAGEARAMAEQTDRIRAAQLSDGERRAKADRVIETTTPEAARAQVQVMLAEIRETLDA